MATSESRPRAPKSALSRILQRNASARASCEPSTTPSSFYDNVFIDLSSFKGVCTTCGYSSGRAFENSLDSLLGKRNPACPACSLLFEGISTFIGRENAEKLRRENVGVYQTHLGLNYSESKSPRGELNVKLPPYGPLEFYVEEGKSSPCKDIGWARTISPDPLSPKGIALCQAWLSDCVEQHGSLNCTPYTESSLPVRVLHVGFEGKDPFLYETQGEKARYVALSYCWGGALPLNTTFETLPSRKQGIPIADLPDTLRDAVLVVRKFGISYLWIDALCILQDSIEDWATESSKMGNIFAEAFFVIRADAAPDCRSGFLHRPMIHVSRKTAEIKCPGYGGSSKTVLVRRQQAKSLGDVTHSGFGPSRLSTRGWAFQERYLAKRSLIFGKAELAWECRSITKCECKLSVRESLDFLKYWAVTVESYSALQLTRSSDRLAAFSGIAARYHGSSRLFGAYLCGLWMEKLGEQLLWYTTKPSYSEVTSKRHDSYQAPSWSWASITGPVTYYHRELDATCRAKGFRILGAYCKPATSNPYGPVVPGAHIKVSGSLCPVQIRKPSGSSNFSVLLLPDQQSEELIPLPDSLPTEPKRGSESHVGWSTIIHSKDRNVRVWNLKQGFYPDVIGPEPDISLKEVHYFLLILKTNVLFAGLILQKSRSNPGGMAMERIGFCCGNAQGTGLPEDYSSSKEKSFELLSDLFDSLPITEVTIL